MKAEQAIQEVSRVTTFMTTTKEGKENGWIKTGERLPEPDRWVLCHFHAPSGERVQAIGFYHSVHKLFIGVNCCEVTHWRPLPELPGES